MKKLILIVSMLFASSAMAQAVVPNAPEPAAGTLTTNNPTVPGPASSPAVPTPAPAPAAPIANGTAPQVNIAPVIAPTAPMVQPVQPVTLAPGGVTSTPAVPASTVLQTTPTAAAPAPTPLPIDLNAAVGKLAGNTNSQQKLGQVMVIGSIMNCTQKTAGKPQTDAFYQQMQVLSKTVEAQCKAGKSSDARTTVLDTLNAKHNDPVVKAMLTCYDSQSAMVANLGGQQVATDAAHYSRWLKNPETAKAEMQESDVCRKSK
jgi:hypothetical protein